ncbi:hypothetical protein [Staphylococcus hominis]|uniref:hypothetical protein n=1 Tax=Staphylococcus hominis TaxID=1290 RepID=UPI0026DFD99F|nr:hypothetical protein [Staphylococcus hominis]MDS3872180.1 hypothetical protein [Staphylococcus hominis]WRY64862.1 hypothetical protein P8632_07030 [Staphylococcus hominis]
MAKKLDVNKQNIMNAINWIINNEEEIIFESQSQLSFFSREDLKKIDYCKRTLESLLDAKEIYNKQKVS